VDDSRADNVISRGESQESQSKSHHTGAMSPEVNDPDSTQTLTSSSNGSSARRIEANRRNAKKSTGPKTALGKTSSSWNSTRHGLLSKRLPILVGRSKKNFARLLSNLRQDLAPVGTLEEVLVEKMAQEYWRLSVAAWHEAEELDNNKPFSKTEVYRILRYQTTINRQLFQAMNQLERLQRLRKGENVPAPLNLEVLGDTTAVLKGENSSE